MKWELSVLSELEKTDFSCWKVCCTAEARIHIALGILSGGYITCPKSTMMVTDDVSLDSRLYDVRAVLPVVLNYWYSNDEKDIYGPKKYSATMVRTNTITPLYRRIPIPKPSSSSSSNSCS